MERSPTAVVSANLDEKLRHLSPAAQAAFRRFQSSRAADDLAPVVFGILEDFIPRPPEQPLAEQPGAARLIEDLGFDSIAIAELIFFTEDLFGITISNDEILQVRTLDELRQFVFRKVTGARAG